MSRLPPLSIEADPRARSIAALMVHEHDPAALMVASIIGEPSWQRDALCREPAYATAIFFPGRGEPLDAARAVCARCPVSAECLAFALADRTLSGVWAGTSDRERSKMRGQRRRAAALAA